MVSLTVHRHFRPVQKLPFCYVCGKDFVPGENQNRDHVPAKKAFHVRDRSKGPVLWLPTHWNCNNGHSETDEKIGQIIGMKWGKVTSNSKLELLWFGSGRAAVTNLNIKGVVLRWACAFHAALYREPLLLGSIVHSVITPFPTAPRTNHAPEIFPVLPQHRAFVQTIKEQRILRNVDEITLNNCKLTYECVWVQSDDGEEWLCVFALDFYDWKNLGRTPGQPERGCAGFYSVPGGVPPEAATRKRTTAIIIPNVDDMDPFGP